MGVGSGALLGFFHIACRKTTIQAAANTKGMTIPAARVDMPTFSGFFRRKSRPVKKASTCGFRDSRRTSFFSQSETHADSLIWRPSQTKQMSTPNSDKCRLGRIRASDLMKASIPPFIPLITLKTVQ